MTIQVIEGKKEEIAEKIGKISGQVTRAIVWIEDEGGQAPNLMDVDAIMAELDRDTVSVGHVDDSREALYTRLENE
jgi:hypothetical protein